MRFAVAIALAGASMLAGCGPNCQDTCFHIYSPDECDVSTPGVEWTEKVSDCITDCDNALQTPGQLGTYDPDAPNTTGESVSLDNERQAAAWMDCVAERDCKQLEDGYCAPI